MNKPFVIRRVGGLYWLEREGRAPVACATREQAWALAQRAS